MQRFSIHALGMALVLTSAGLALAQERKERSDPPPKQDSPTTTLKGKIVRLQAPDQFVVRTDANKEVVFHTNPQTRYLIDNKASKYSDLRVGVEISAGYTLQGDRHIADSVTVGAVRLPVIKEGQPPIGTEIRDVPRGTRLRGKIVRMEGDDRVIVRVGTKETILYTNPQTRYRIDNKVARFADLRVGAEVNAYYTLEGERHVVSVIADGEADVDDPSIKGTTVEGTVIRIEGTDQVIIKTKDNKEVIVYVNPMTTYTFEEKTGRFSDVRPGGEIRIDYTVRDRRNLAGRILGLPRRDR